MNTVINKRLRSCNYQHTKDAKLKMLRNIFTPAASYFKKPAGTHACCLLVISIMRRKRSPSLHQKQMRWFTIFFGSLLMLAFAAFLWLLNCQSLR